MKIPSSAIAATYDADVLVIGGGLAGLSVADRLAGKGISALVLEAQQRVGGRTLTVPTELGHVDLGGQFVGPHDMPLLALAERLGVQIFPTYVTGERVLEVEGRVLRYHGLIPPVSLVNKVVLYLGLRRLDRMRRAVPLDAPWTAKQAEAWDRLTVESWKRQTFRSQAARDLFDAAVRVIMSAEPTELSLLHFLFYLNSGGGLDYLAESHNGAQQSRFVLGAQELSTRLAAHLGDRAVVDAEVLAIQQDATGVTVRTRTRGAYRGRYAISTVPPVPARRITYAPMLPPLALRDQLMEHMPMGATTKAVAIYDEAFWRSEGRSGEAVSTAGPVTATFDNTSHDGRQPALMGFVVGKHARKMGRLSTDEQRRAVLGAFERFFGPKATKPAAFYIKDWQVEGSIGGCYVASMAPGAMTRSGTALRAWAGRLGFAGTETAMRWNGYMAGALDSAERVVDEVVGKL